MKLIYKPILINPINFLINPYYRIKNYSTLIMLGVTTMPVTAENIIESVIDDVLRDNLERKHLDVRCLIESFTKDNEVSEDISKLLNLILDTLAYKGYSDLTYNFPKWTFVYDSLDEPLYNSNETDRMISHAEKEAYDKGFNEGFKEGYDSYRSWRDNQDC